MDKNVLDKEEIHYMKIICEQDDATNIFEDLKCGDVFRLSHFKHDSNTYMRVNNAFDNIINVVRLDDGMPFIFQNDTKVEKYNAILTIEKKC